MGCEVIHGRLYDTVSELSFGPQCADDEEAARLFHHVHRVYAIDPRAAGRALLALALEEVHAGTADAMPTSPRMLCACGSGRPFNVTSHHRGLVKTFCPECRGTAVPAGREIGLR